MTNDKDSTTPKRARSPVSSHQSSSPVIDKAPSSPITSSLEDNVDSQKGRARAASQASSIERRRLPSISKAFQLESPSDICLCQPDPKVPRPRNAFILYRQHYQAAVVAQNPGLANPEISKVIGEQWRDSSPEVKNHWKSLADEEKLRHQKQHPNYRYQPRRSARNNSLSSPQNTPLESPRCPKCGRKTITTPSLPSSTFSASSSNPSSNQHTPMTPFTPTVPSSVQRHAPVRGSPQLPSAGFKNTAALLASPCGKRPSFSQGPQSPDFKRRRMAPAQAYGLGIRNATSPATPFFPPLPGQQHQRMESLPGPGTMFLPNLHPEASGDGGGGRGEGFAMGPPPRPHAHYNRHLHHQSPSPAEENLRLPPIQTHLQLQNHKEREEGHKFDQARGLKAMIVGIGAVGKIKTLARIAPPLGRGAKGVVIAVDGEEVAVGQVVGFLKEMLQSAETAKIFKLATEVRDGEKSGGGAEKTYDEYHALVQRYLQLSKEVKEFISHPLATAPPQSSRDELSPSPVSPKTIPGPRTRSAQQSADLTAARSIPIAIIPRYQLSQADTFACSIPIADAYSPADHWQWMASLWRGVVGPDLTIAIRPNAVDTPPNTGNPRARGKAGRSGAAAVEVRLEDARAILLTAEEDGKIGEGSLRRVGFEVGEWIRGKSTDEPRQS